MRIIAGHTGIPCTAAAAVELTRLVAANAAALMRFLGAWLPSGLRPPRVGDRQA